MRERGVRRLMQVIRWERYPYVAAHSRTRQWLETQAMLGLAPATIHAYGRGANDYLAFCQRTSRPVVEATREDVVAYLAEMTQRPNPRGDAVRYLHSGVGLANATMQQRLTVVRLLYGYFIDERIRRAEQNPVGRGRFTPGRAFAGKRERGLLRHDERLPWIPGDDEWEAILQAACGEPVRNRLMLLLAYDGALRRSELVALTLRDLAFPHQQITVRPEVAKNGRGRVVMFGDVARELLQRYLDERAVTGVDGGPLFRSQSDRNRAQGLRPDAWDKVVARMADEAGLTHRFTTHTPRHLRLTDLARAGLDLHAIRAVRRAPRAGNDQAVHPLERPRDRRACARASARTGSAPRATPGRKAVIAPPPMVEDSGERTSRWSPLDLARYNRSLQLAPYERAALARLSTSYGRRAGQPPEEVLTALQRLLEPLVDALAVFGIRADLRTPVVQVLVREMAARATVYWAWTETEWQEILQPTFRAFSGRYPDRADQTVRQQLLVVAYLVGPLTDLSSTLLRSVSTVALARRLFGAGSLEAALRRVLPVIESWGYASVHQREDLRAALAEALLTNRSPHVEDLTAEVLDQLGERTRGHLRHSLGRLSRALTHLGLIDVALPRGPARRELEARLNTTDVPPTWAEWCLRWYRSADLASKTKGNYLHVLLRVGRWLSHHHPEITTPHQWTVHLAAEYVAAVAEMRVGDLCDAVHTATILPNRFGRPLSPRSQDRQLAILRAFFRDLQEAPHQIPRRFDPARAFRTPRTVRHQIGPKPRDIDPLVWARLVHAATSLTEVDLPRIGGRHTGALRYPLELVRAVAVVWVYAGLRADEIVRLRVGCIRWQREDVTPAGTDAVLPRDAVCFLSVPVNKTSGAFVKPVNTLVGKRIAEWEQVRAASQPPQRDPKSGGSVAYLFAHRGQRLGLRYLNASVIPTLCRKAGIPQADERGAITSHRARATIATRLYTAPEGLTIWELMEWLGHKDPKSTQHYARVNPPRLASAYTHADRSSHLVEVLVDTKAEATGEVPLYYVLGDHGLCSNPAWATCEYRMACIKCPFFVPSEPAQLIRSRQTVKHFLEIVELSDHELAAAQDDEQKLAANIQRTQNLRPPQMLRRRAKGAAAPGIPLTALAAATLPTV